MNEIWGGVVTVAVAIVGVAIVAVLVSNQAQTGNVISSLTGGFAKDLQAAENPFSGGGANLFGGSSFSGGANSIYNQ